MRNNIHESTSTLGQRLIDYCVEFDIPIEYFFDIINDQKVVPMLRGKGMEYNAYLLLNRTLPHAEWDVQKLNLAAQPGSPDEDVSITHRRTGIILKVESKSAVRGSASIGARSRMLKDTPHFKVKCHRSRSNIKFAQTTNDRYKCDEFDVLLTNPINAMYEGGTVGEHLELIQDPDLLQFLMNHYQVRTSAELITAMSNDWRFVIPTDIGERGFIPRTPYVRFLDDPNWARMNRLEGRLIQLVSDRRQARGPNGRRRHHN